MSKSVLFAGFGLGAVAIGAGTFWLYSGLRTMDETWGISGRSMAKSAALCSLAAGPIVLPIVWFNRRRRKSITALLGMCVVMSMAIAEFRILADEMRFLDEASDRDTAAMPEGGIYSRSRSWPNQSGFLVYIKGKGFHATD